MTKIINTLLSNPNFQSKKGVLKKDLSERNYITKKNEQVYSLGEKMIADFFYDNNIEYEYESIRLIDLHKYLPDFYLPGQDVFIEYQGMERNPQDRKRYDVKRYIFEREGLKVLYIYPRDLDRLSEYLNEEYYKCTGRYLIASSKIYEANGQLHHSSITSANLTSDFTQSQIEALKILNANDSVFLSGEAGTGKSFLIHQFLRDKKKPEYRILASTGTAAIKLGGCTFHSFFKLGILSGGHDKVVNDVRNDKKLIERLNNTKCIIIDEISMLTGETLFAAERLSRIVRNNNNPWGGIRVIAVGDFAQLPPVSRNKKEKDWAFLSSVWLRSNFKNVVLETVVRTKDPVYLKMLQAIRSGEMRTEVLQYFENKVIKNTDEFIGTRLFARKNRVDEYNLLKLHQIDQQLHVIPTLYEGNRGYIEILKRMAPIPEYLNVKVGALVMVRINDAINLDSTMRYANGSLGYVHSISDTQLVVDLLSGKRVYFPKKQFSITDANGDVKAWAVNFPITLGWAMTIHKAQGATLDKVLVEADGLWESGQAYVALSRTRTGDNLFLTGWSTGSVIQDPSVTKFYRELHKFNR